MNRTLKTLIKNVLRKFDVGITRYSTLETLLANKYTLALDVEGAGVEGVRASVFDYYLSRAKGVLHMGAHLGQEAEEYAEKKKNVIWVEAIPFIHSRLRKKIESIPHQSAFCALLTDRDGELRTFHISSNGDGVSSSIFEFGEYGNGDHALWPNLDLRMIDQLALSTTRLDTLLKKINVDASNYDMWVMDLQGAELLALKGSGSLLDHCNSIYTEVSLVEVYRGGVIWQELEGYLSRNGFTPLWQPIWEHDEVLFVR